MPTDEPRRGFTMVPHWLLEQGVSGTALLVYCTLASFGTWDMATCTYEECRPSVPTLARRLGLSEATVRRALKELVSLGALVGTDASRADGGSAPKVYRVVFGVITRPVAATPLSSMTGGGVTSDRGAPRTDDREGVSPVTPNQEVINQEPLDQDSSSSARTARSSPVTKVQEEEEGSIDPKSPPKSEAVANATKILDEVQRVGGALNGSRLRGRERDQLVSAIAERLESGWVPQHVTVALEGDLSSVQSVYGTLRYRVQERLAGAPPTTPPPRATQATERCPTCAPYRPGWIDADQDHPARCPCATPRPGQPWRPGFVVASDAVLV